MIVIPSEYEESPDAIFTSLRSVQNDSHVIPSKGVSPTRNPLLHIHFNRDSSSLRSSEWHRLSSRTYVRDPSQYARLGSSRQNLSEWYITVSVTSLGRRFFISLTLHSEWHMFWQEILQGKSHVTIVWREILHFTTISFRMTVKCHSEQMRGISRFYPSVWDILYRLLTMRGSLLSFFFLQLSIW